MAHLDINNPAIWTGLSIGHPGVTFQTVEIWGQSSAGVTISEEVALQLSTVWACIKVISEDVAVLPWHVFRRVSETTRARLTDHPVERVLDVEPNPEMTALTFRELILRWALSYGNGYAEIERDAGGRAKALWPIHPSNMKMIRDEADGQLYYLVRDEFLFEQKNIFHLKGPSPDGFNGWPVLSMALHTIGLAVASEQFGSEFFANGTHFTGLLKTAATLSDEAKKGLRDAWSRMYEGPTNRHKFAILDGGLEWHPLGVTSEDAALLETRKFQVSEIARWFRVPPHKIGDLTRSTYNNIEHQSIEYVSDALLPWICRLEHEANRKLFTRRNVYGKLMVQAQMRTDSKTRAEFYRTMFNLGAVSINEIRAREDENPIGPEGDERFMQSAMVTVDSIVNPPEPEPVPAPLLPTEETEEDDEEQEEETSELMQRIYSPILLDLFSTYMEKTRNAGAMTAKLKPLARTILRAHELQEDAALQPLIEEYVRAYLANSFEQPPLAFVDMLLREYDDNAATRTTDG